MTGKTPANTYPAYDQVPLWTRPFVFLMLQNLLFWVAMNMFATVLPGYVLAIGGTAAQTGILVGLFSYAALLLRPVSGVLLDRWERRKVLLAGTALATAVSFAYPFLSFLTGLAILRLIHGLGFSAYSTASSTMAADIVPESRMSEGLGVFGLANTISMAMGPSIGLALVRYGYQNLFLVISGLMVVSLVLVFWIDGSVKSRFHEPQHEVIQNQPEVTKAHDSSPQTLLALIQGMLEKSALRPSLVAFFMLIAVGSIMAFLPLYGLDRGFDNIGLFFTVYAGALILA
ncbi:MAG: MFS transporter, partial [Clostridia bacterium]|nr:MFS transporter [Clostridia bacterium]